MNFTEAALSAGFSDQAHFNKVFSKTFGISPNGLKKNSRFIQVYL
jgi:AraC-like DNA-binding protein